MDIWGWVYDVEEKLREEGKNSLADGIDKLPSDTVDGRHQEIDNYIGELVAEAKNSGHSWVELFIRHWYLQSKVLHRNEPKDAIKEAVSLLEFAHTEENRDCPQSICVVQDLANSYGAFDGPGYAEERLAVAAESLEKINPNWPCYKCIGAEYVEALQDAKRYDECIEFLDKVDNDFIESGRSKDTSHLLLTRVDVLADLGKFKKARKLAKKLSSWGGGNSFILESNMFKARIEALDGNYEKALALRPSFEKIKVELPSLYDYWSEIQYHILCNMPAQQTPENIQTMLEVALEMEARGTYRQAFNAYGWLLELSQLLPTSLDTDDLLMRMEKMMGNLNKDLGAAARLAGLAKSVNQS